MAAPLSVRFVLVRPSSALNIGAVARALANFGFDDLAAVSPHDPRWREAQSASYGSDLLQRARVGALQEVTEDCSLVLGTASAHNRTMRRTVVTLPALRTWLRRRLPKGGRAALLLGSEKNGLDNTGDLLRASWVKMQQPYGKSSCRCSKAKRHWHLSWYVSQSKDGKQRMKCVSRAQLDEVRRWVSRYQEARKLLAIVGDEYWDRIGKPRKRKR